jgi:sirohydrochlorin cobaltochelatase
LADDGLLVIGHGSARYPDAGGGLHAHVRRIGATRPVRAGLLNGMPSVGAAVAGLPSTGVIRVVPFFMEDGYFTRVAVPRALNGLMAADRLLFCPAVGLHAGMGRLIEARVLDGCAARDLDPASVVLLLVGHGSATAPGQALSLHRHAAWLTKQNKYSAVATACLEEPPFVADVLSSLRAHTVAVVGFFAGAGAHMRDDLPRLIAVEHEARGSAGFGVHNLGCVTDDPAMAQIILDQARLG